MSLQQDPQTYKIIGAAMEVHREMRCGFLEAVYQEALAMEFAKQEIPFQSEANLLLGYKEAQLKTTYRADFICFDHPKILVEIKALDKISGREEAQILNYLKATKIEIGLLINFGAKSLEYKRFIKSI